MLGAELVSAHDPEYYVGKWVAPFPLFQVEKINNTEVIEEIKDEIKRLQKN
jgi:hypothetical protein